MERTEAQKLLLESVRKVVRERVAPTASETDRKGEIHEDILSLFWELGLLQIPLPEEYGGWTERPCHTLCLCTEEIAKACASSALLLVVQSVGSYPLILAGDERQKRAFLPRISHGRQLMGYLVTESGAGSDVASIATRASKQDGSYLLQGQKIFASNGGVAGLYSVLTRTGEKDLSMFIVERERQGVVVGKQEDKCGFRGSNTTEVILEHVSVPEENLLGDEGDGFPIAMSAFDMSRPTVAALALGISEGALEYALRYAKERESFGIPLSGHQAIQFMLADACTLIEAGRGLMERAAILFDTGKKNTGLASMAKCFCSDAAMEITSDMVQILGGYGYMREYPLERMFRDAKLTQIFEGTNQIQRLVIAREIIKTGPFRE